MTDIVKGELKDLTGLALAALPGLDDPVLGSMLARVLRRVDRPGQSISGYNGAGGYSTMDADDAVSGQETPA